jgi:hypothetical protein
MHRPHRQAHHGTALGGTAALRGATCGGFIFTLKLPGRFQLFSLAIAVAWCFLLTNFQVQKCIRTGALMHAAWHASFAQCHDQPQAWCSKVF